MIVGGYTMDLYCRHETLPTWFEDGPVPAGYHGYERHMGKFYGQTEAECRKDSKKRGWKWRDGDVTCPHCSQNPPPVIQPGSDQAE